LQTSRVFCRRSIAIILKSVPLRLEVRRQWTVLHELSQTEGIMSDATDEDPGQRILLSFSRHLHFRWRK
jgi:hypothetical protein